MNLNCHYRTFQVLPVIIYDFVQLPILIKIRTTVFVMELVNYKFKSVCVCFVGSSSVVSITPGKHTSHKHKHILTYTYTLTYPHKISSKNISTYVDFCWYTRWRHRRRLLDSISVLFAVRDYSLLKHYNIVVRSVMLSSV